MNKNITPARRLAVAAEALVLVLLLTPLVLIARLISPPAAPQPAPAAPVVALPVAPMDGAPAAEALPSWTPQVVAACSAPSPAAGRQAPPLATMTTVQLRRLAQQQGHRNIGGRRTSKARRSDLIAALS